VKRKHLFLLTLVICLLLFPLTSAAAFNLELDEIFGQELQDEDYYQMISEEGEVLLITGRRIYEEDEYLTSDNRLFRVMRVEEKLAYAAFIEEIDLQKHLQENFRSEVRAVLAASSAQDGGEGGVSRLIGLYHTHNAESYIPTDGTDSINGVGGIHEVGKSFKAALEDRGINVIHDETLHLPHDRGAYRRSRVTAQNLLAQGPDVIFDVHRDAAPREAYALAVDDEWITQVQFVVGRQNHNFSINRSFAFDLKGYADDITPELIKGVFFAHGNYNQDLTPLNLLLEVGAHTNTREAAEEGIAFFAETVDFYFYGPDPGEAVPPVPGAEAPAGTRLGFWAALRTILGILAFLVVGGAGLLWINAGSSEEFRRILSLYGQKAQELWQKTLLALRENWAWERDTAFLREKWAWAKKRFEEIRRQSLK
jgi:stage II sporulation protein P